MGKMKSFVLALALAAGSCLGAFSVCASQDAGTARVMESEGPRIEQVSVNMPEVALYVENLSEEQAEGAEGYIGSKKLAFDSCVPCSESGEGISYYLLLDISGSIPDRYFSALKDSIQEFQDCLAPEDRLVLCAFGTEVTLAADGSQGPEEMRKILEGLENKDQETLLFEAIDRAAELAGTDTQNIRRVLVVMTDGEDFATGKKQSQEALAKLRGLGLPVYALCIRDTAKENINSFGEFARTSGGDMTVFTPKEGTEPGLLTSLSERLESCIRVNYVSDSNVVSNEEETFTLKLADGTNLSFAVMNNRWIPDTEAPYLVDSSAVNEKQLRLVFNEPLNGTDNPANYSLSVDGRDIGITSVSYEEGNHAVMNLFLAEPAANGTYTLACSNITDASMEKNPLRGSASGDMAQEDGSGGLEAAGSNVARLLFEILDLPEPEPAPPKRGPGLPPNLAAILFLVFAALAALLVTLIVLAGKKKAAAKEADDPKGAPQQAKGEDIRLAGEEFRQHVSVQEDKKRLDVWLSRTGMQTQQTAWEIGNSLFVGRAPICDIVIDDRSLSGQHFCLERENGGIYITDLDSTNGTSVNGIRIGSRRKLEPGSVIEAGSMKITIRW